MSQDSKFMRLAIELARRGVDVSPNPRVGAVIVKDDEILGRGWHDGPGTKHAEVAALEEAAETANGATLYLTLEPCTHQGNTPPCVDAVITAGITRVVVGVSDPDARVNGKGIERLRSVGIEVKVGVEDRMAAMLIEAYAVQRSLGRPFVICKTAISLDGRVAAVDGSSRWITAEESRQDAHELRGSVDAICVGVGTVLADDPLLTVRGPKSKHQRTSQPLRVVVDTSGRIPKDSQVLSEDAETIVFTTKLLDSDLREKAIVVSASDGRVDLEEMLSELASRGILSLLVEGGPTLIGSFVLKNLVDRFVFYVAPKLLGEASLGMIGGWAAKDIESSLDLDISSVERIGSDIKIIAQPMVRAS